MPALYRDEQWEKPKLALDRQEISAFRRTAVSSDQNRALAACAAFRGDVLIVESEHDERIPHETILWYLMASTRGRSLTYRVIGGADRALSDEEQRQMYSAILTKWATDMVFGARRE